MSNQKLPLDRHADTSSTALTFSSPRLSYKSLNAHKAFLIIAQKKDVYTIIQNTDTIIQTLVPTHTHGQISHLSKQPW